MPRSKQDILQKQGTRSRHVQFAPGAFKNETADPKVYVEYHSMVVRYIPIATILEHCDRGRTGGIHPR